MSLFIRNGKATCVTITPLIQFKRFRGKINIQKPKPPHFDKARYLALTKPWYLCKNFGKTNLELCSKTETPFYKKQDERNIFQEIIAQELNRWFTASNLIAFCHYNPMTREQEFNAYLQFKNAGMHFKQYGKKTLELAVKGTPNETLLDFYISRNLTIFSPEPEIKKMLRVLKKFPQLVLMAGIYKNRLLSKDELVHYSTIPNLQTAQASLVQTLNSASLQLVGNLNSHQTTLVSHLEQRVKQLGEE